MQEKNPDHSRDSSLSLVMVWWTLAHRSNYGEAMGLAILCNPSLQFFF